MLFNRVILHNFERRCLKDKHSDKDTHAINNLYTTMCVDELKVLPPLCNTHRMERCKPKNNFVPTMKVV